MSGRSTLVDIEATLVHETHPEDTEAGAFLLDTGRTDGKKIWVPKCMVARDGNTFTMPEALAQEKGLI